MTNIGIVSDEFTEDGRPVVRSYAPSPLNNLVSLLYSNARLQGVPRPILEVVVDETVKILNARIPDHLRRAGLDVMHSNWTAMQCTQCGVLTPSRIVSERLGMSQAALCVKCKDEYTKKIAPTPISEGVYSTTEEGVGPVVMDSVLAEARVAHDRGAAAVLAKLEEEYKDRGGVAGLVEAARVRKEQELMEHLAEERKAYERLDHKYDEAIAKLEATGEIPTIDITLKTASVTAGAKNLATIILGPDGVEAEHGQSEAAGPSEGDVGSSSDELP